MSTIEDLVKGYSEYKLWIEENNSKLKTYGHDKFTGSDGVTITKESPTFEGMLEHFIKTPPKLTKKGK